MLRQSLENVYSRHSTLVKHKQAKGEHRLIKTKQFLQKQQQPENSLLNRETQHYISNEMDMISAHHMKLLRLSKVKANLFQNNEGIFWDQYKLSSINRMLFTTKINFHWSLLLLI